MKIDEKWLSDYLDHKQMNESGSIKKLSKRICCLDGASVSVQASSLHYSTPRSNVGPYTHAEVGFPTVDPDEELLSYAEDKEHPKETVYGFVPLRLIVDYINSHGGVDEETLNKNEIFV